MRSPLKWEIRFITYLLQYALSTSSLVVSDRFKRCWSQTWRVLRILWSHSRIFRAFLPLIVSGWYNLPLYFALETCWTTKDLNFWFVARSDMESNLQYRNIHSSGDRGISRTLRRMGCQPYVFNILWKKPYRIKENLVSPLLMKTLGISMIKEHRNKLYFLHQKFYFRNGLLYWTPMSEIFIHCHSLFYSYYWCCKLRWVRGSSILTYSLFT